MQSVLWCSFYLSNLRETLDLQLMLLSEHSSSRLSCVYVPYMYHLIPMVPKLCFFGGMVKTFSALALFFQSHGAMALDSKNLTHIPCCLFHPPSTEMSVVFPIVYFHHDTLLDHGLKPSGL